MHAFHFQLQASIDANSVWVSAEVQLSVYLGNVPRVFISRKEYTILGDIKTGAVKI